MKQEYGTICQNFLADTSLESETTDQAYLRHRPNPHTHKHKHKFKSSSSLHVFLMPLDCLWISECILAINSKHGCIEEGFLQKRRQRSSLLLGGTELLQFFAAHNNKIAIAHGKELKQFCPPRSSDDFCLLFCLYSSSLHFLKHILLTPKICCIFSLKNKQKPNSKYLKSKMSALISVTWVISLDTSSPSGPLVTCGRPRQPHPHPLRLPPASRAVWR